MKDAFILSRKSQPQSALDSRAQEPENVKIAKNGMASMSTTSIY